MHWNQVRPGLFVTDDAPQRIEEVQELEQSLARLVAKSRGPISIVFDVTGRALTFSSDVVQSYLRILTSQGDPIEHIYVASDSAVVRFAGSAARFVLKDRLVMVPTLEDALALHERRQLAALV